MEEQWAGKQGPPIRNLVQTRPPGGNEGSCHRHPTQDPGRPKPDRRILKKELSEMKVKSTTIVTIMVETLPFLLQGP